MATAIASSQAAQVNDANLVITKPTGLDVGDVMIAIVSSSTLDTSADFTPPAGWTQLETLGDGTANVIMNAFAIIATSTETAASDFTFTRGSTNMWNLAGAIFRITGTNGFNALSTNVFSNSATSLPAAGVTTPTTGSVLLIAVAKENGTPDTNFSGYSIVNNDPTWTEQYDLYESTGSASQIDFGVASATYNFEQDTGNFTVTGAGAGIIVAVTENFGRTVSPAVINLTSSVQAPAVSGGATVSPAVINLTASVQAPTVATAASKWKNTAKSDTNPTITNTPKS